MLNLFTGNDEAAGPAGDLRVVSLLDRGVLEAESLNAEPGVQVAMYRTLGGIYQKLGDLSKAESLLTTALERRRSMFGPEIRPSRARQRRSGWCWRNADPTRKRSRCSKTRRGCTRRGNRRSTDLAATLRELFNTQFYAGNFATADEIGRRVLTMTRQLNGERHALVAEDLINLGAVRYERGQYSEAERLYREALAITENWYGKEHFKTGSNLTIAIYEEAQGAKHMNTGSARIKLGRALLNQSRYAEAEKELLTGHEILTTQTSPSVTWIKEARVDLVTLYTATRQPEKAKPFSSELR
jgi:eukaryotic-like serine/threonine-protein kinase